MANVNSQPMFFLGANSPQGFISRFDSSYNPRDGWHTYIIKGGPGTGKSTLMKRVADFLIKQNVRCHLCPCSSDPSSLDGVIFPDLKVVLLDGTSPHVVEPQFPGAVEEIINLGDCWDSKILRQNSDEIITLSKINKMYHRKASNYLKAAGAMKEDLKIWGEENFDKGKALNFGVNLAKKYLPKTLGKPIEWQRYLSGVTPQGHIFYKSTLEKLTDERIVIRDEFSSASSVILESVRAHALKCGYEIITCRCPLNPDCIEHIIIPSIRLSFCTSCRFHEITSTERVIHARRFMNMKNLHSERSRINFARRTLLDMMNSAEDALSDAKLIHDQLEAYYIAAMDKNCLKQKSEDVIKKILETDIGCI